MMLLIDIYWANQVLDLISTLYNLLEVAVMCDIINWSFQVPYDLGVSYDFIEMTLMIGVINRAYQVLQLFLVSAKSPQKVI